VEHEEAFFVEINWWKISLVRAAETKKRTSEEVEWWDGKRGELGRQPTLPDAEREERAETSAVNTLVRA
jgi:hypothetical protein